MPVLNESDVSKLKRWNETQEREVPVQFLDPGGTACADFYSFRDTVAKVAPRLRILTEKVESDDLPTFILGERWQFQLVPHGTEIEPFLEVASAFSGLKPEVPGWLRARVEALEGDLNMEIFVTAQCPFCSGVIRTITPLVFAHPRGRVTVIDGLTFPHLADALQIRTVPTLILNGIHRLTGAVELPAILSLLEASDFSLLGKESLQRMLKEGQASLLAGMMVERNGLFPGFLPLMVHPEWSVRLGAMVVMEEMAPARLHLVQSALHATWEGLPGYDAAVRGDILYMIGEWGGREWIARLRTFLAIEEDKEVRTVIEEALSKLERSEIH